MKVLFVYKLNIISSTLTLFTPVSHFYTAWKRNMLLIFEYIFPAEQEVRIGIIFVGQDKRLWKKFFGFNVKSTSCSWYISFKK